MPARTEKLIGLANDDPGILTKAAEYLRRHKEETNGKD